jgi:hypothetical protein
MDDYPLILIIGRRGSGKSTYLRARFLAERGYNGKYMFDTLAEHVGTKDFVPGVASGIWATDFSHGWFGKIEQLKKVIFVPRPGVSLNSRFSEFVNAVHIQEGKKLIALEEVDKFCSPTHAHPALNDLIEYSRHYQISLVVTSRRVAQVRKSLTANASEIVVFQTTHPDDRARLREFGMKDDDIPVEPHKFFVFNP